MVPPSSGSAMALQKQGADNKHMLVSQDSGEGYPAQQDPVKPGLNSKPLHADSPDSTGSLHELKDEKWQARADAGSPQAVHRSARSHHHHHHQQSGSPGLQQAMHIPISNVPYSLMLQAQLGQGPYTLQTTQQLAARAALHQPQLNAQLMLQNAIAMNSMNAINATRMLAESQAGVLALGPHGFLHRGQPMSNQGIAAGGVLSPAMCGPAGAANPMLLVQLAGHPHGPVGLVPHPMAYAALAGGGALLHGGLPRGEVQAAMGLEAMQGIAAMQHHQHASSNGLQQHDKRSGKRPSPLQQQKSSEHDSSVSNDNLAPSSKRAKCARNQQRRNSSSSEQDGTIKKEEKERRRGAISNEVAPRKAHQETAVAEVDDEQQLRCADEGLSSCSEAEQVQHPPRSMTWPNMQHPQQAMQHTGTTRNMLQSASLPATLTLPMSLTVPGLLPSAMPAVNTPHPTLMAAISRRRRTARNMTLPSSRRLLRILQQLGVSEAVNHMSPAGVTASKQVMVPSHIAATTTVPAPVVAPAVWQQLPIAPAPPATHVGINNNSGKVALQQHHDADNKPLIKAAAMSTTSATKPKQQQQTQLPGVFSAWKAAPPATTSISNEHGRTKRAAAVAAATLAAMPSAKARRKATPVRAAC